MGSADLSVTVRPLTPADEEALITATVGNVNWTGVERLTRAEVLAVPQLRHYTRLDPDRGHFGLAALLGDVVIGLAWAVLLPDDAPGYGFVDTATPELSLWVAAPVRRRGLGRRLLRALQDEARDRGLPGLSLSVEDGNRARVLYLAEGFVDVPGREADGVMMWVPQPPGPGEHRIPT